MVPPASTWYLLLMLRSIFHFTSMRYCDDIIFYYVDIIYYGDTLIFIASVDDNASTAAEAVAVRCRGGGKLDDSSGNKKMNIALTFLIIQSSCCLEFQLYT